MQAIRYGVWIRASETWSLRVQATKRPLILLDRPLGLARGRIRELLQYLANVYTTFNLFHYGKC